MTRGDSGFRLIGLISVMIVPPHIFCNMHSSYDTLLFSLAHPRWEFIFQSKYAEYLNLIGLWWKTLRSLAFKGRRFEVRTEMLEPIRKPPFTGTSTSIPTSGAEGGDTVLPASSASLLYLP